MDVWSEGDERELTTLLSSYGPCLQVVHKRKSEVRNRTAMKAKRSLFSILNQELEVYTRGTDHQRFSNGAANAYGDRRLRIFGRRKTKAIELGNDDP